MFPETNILKFNSSKTKIFKSFKCNIFLKQDYIFQCPLIIYNSKCRNYLKVFIIYNSISKKKACSYCVKITCCFWYAVSGRILDSKRRDPVTQRIHFLNSHVCTEPIKIVHAHCPYWKETHLVFFNNSILVCTMFFLCFAWKKKPWTYKGKKLLCFNVFLQQPALLIYHCNYNYIREQKWPSLWP